MGLPGKEKHRDIHETLQGDQPLGKHLPLCAAKASLPCQPRQPCSHMWAAPAARQGQLGRTLVQKENEHHGIPGPHILAPACLLQWGMPRATCLPQLPSALAPHCCHCWLCTFPPQGEAAIYAVMVFIIARHLPLPLPFTQAGAEPAAMSHLSWVSASQL